MTDEGIRVICDLVRDVLFGAAVLGGSVFLFLFCSGAFDRE